MEAAASGLEGQRGPAERAVEVEVLQPAVKAILVEHVGAGQPPHVAPWGEPVQADHAIGVGTGAVGVGGIPVDGELVTEDEEAGEAGAHDVVERVGVGRGEEAEVAQDSEEEGVEITYAFPYQHRYQDKR